MICDIVSKQRKHFSNLRTYRPQTSFSHSVAYEVDLSREKHPKVKIFKMSHAYVLHIFNIVLTYITINVSMKIYLFLHNPHRRFKLLFPHTHHQHYQTRAGSQCCESLIISVKQVDQSSYNSNCPLQRSKKKNVITLSLVLQLRIQHFSCVAQYLLLSFGTM